MKKSISLLLIGLLVVPMVFANNLKAELSDGRLALLYPNGSYEIIQKKIPDKLMGYSLKNNNISFLDIIWKEAYLLNCGNFLKSNSRIESDRYSYGNFYLLIITVENPKESPLEFDCFHDWENPIIKCSDDKTYSLIPFMYAYLDDSMPYIGDIFDSGVGAYESKTYYQFFEIPNDVKPLELGMSSLYKKNIEWVSLGNEVQL